MYTAIDRDYFLGRDLLGFKTGRGAYGGHVLGQALNAAVKTVDNPKFIIRSAHCYYLRPVKINTDVVYHVTRLKDGRSVATREVTATQAEKNVFSCLTSFSMEDTEEVGLYHTDQQMPQVDPPPSEPAVVDEVMSKSHLELTLFPMRMSRATLKESKDLPQTG